MVTGTLKECKIAVAALKAWDNSGNNMTDRIVSDARLVKAKAVTSAVQGAKSQLETATNTQTTIDLTKLHLLITKWDTAKEAIGVAIVAQEVETFEKEFTSRKLLLLIYQTPERVESRKLWSSDVSADASVDVLVKHGNEALASFNNFELEHVQS